MILLYDRDELATPGNPYSRERVREGREKEESGEEKSRGNRQQPETATITNLHFLRTEIGSTASDSK